MTLEHEHILIFRKFGDRSYGPGVRHESGYFWEERNEWFSDLWTFPGVSQSLGAGSSKRTAAFNHELPFRLIQMYSVYGDTVLDPFMGTGTTTTAALAAGRNSLGFEIDPEVVSTPLLPLAQARSLSRVTRHERFIVEKLTEDEQQKHFNTPHGFPVKTKQETGIVVRMPVAIHASKPSKRQVSYEVEHEICTSVLTQLPSPKVPAETGK